MPILHRPSADRELRAARLRLLRLRDELCLIRRDHLLRKYNPNQPRVPSGNVGGGQWTSGTGGGGGSGGGNPDSPDGTSLDADTGWSSLGEGWNEDGSIFEQAVTDGAGTTIQSEYAASRAAGFDERQTVIEPNGQTTSFETTADVQTIRDRGPDGEVISQSVWRENGPESTAEVVEARWRRGRGTGGSPLQAAGKLFDWLNSLGEANGPPPILGFRAHDYTPGKVDSFTTSWVGTVERDEVEKACPYMPKIQEMLDDAAREAGPPSNFPSMQAYGTVVHLGVKKRVDTWNNPDVQAERSYFKELREYGEQVYGTLGTARFDVMEKGRDGTRCLYDIKVGRPLSRSRSDVLADAGLRIRGLVSRLLVIEMRPRF